VHGWHGSTRTIVKKPLCETIHIKDLMQVSWSCDSIVGSLHAIKRKDCTERERERESVGQRSKPKEDVSHITIACWINHNRLCNVTSSCSGTRAVGFLIAKQGTSDV
jgi:hypothetical protein